MERTSGDQAGSEGGGWEHDVWVRDPAAEGVGETEVKWEKRGGERRGALSTLDAVPRGRDDRFWT